MTAVCGKDRHIQVRVVDIDSHHRVAATLAQRRRHHRACFHEARKYQRPDAG